MALKIWYRIGRDALSHVRGAFAQSINYDASCRALRHLGVDCVREFPEGNYKTAVQHIPENRGDYLEMWYSDPTLWNIEEGASRNGLGGYIRQAEIPFERVDLLNSLDFLAVPTHFSKAYHDKYLKCPVVVFRGGIYPEEFQYIERDFNSSPFTFLCAGATDWRKGTEIACEAFCSAFLDSDDVKLRIISVGETETFNRLKDKYRDVRQIVFEVVVIDERSEMTKGYYQKGHCLVAPSFIESWPNMAIESMATGMPVITSRCSSMEHLFADWPVWWIEMSGDFIDGVPIPSTESLVEQMWYAYNHRSECGSRGAVLETHVKLELTWEESAEAFLSNLAELRIL